MEQRFISTDGSLPGKRLDGHRDAVSLLRVGDEVDEVDVTEKNSREPWRIQLEHARKKAKLSRPEAAAISGKSVTTWANVELGFARLKGGGKEEYTTTAETLAIMAATVGLDPRQMVIAAFGEEAADEIRAEAVKVDIPGRATVYVVQVEGAMSPEELAEVVREAIVRQDALGVR